MRTYDVVPLTPSLGLLQYVGGTVTLESAVMSGLKGGPHAQAVEAASLKYHEYLGSPKM